MRRGPRTSELDIRLPLFLLESQLILKHIKEPEVNKLTLPLFFGHRFPHYPLKLYSSELTGEAQGRTEMVYHEERVFAKGWRLDRIKENPKK